MSRTPPTVASAHGTIAALKRHHPNSSDRLKAAARDLAAAKLAAYIEATVAAAPPLTPEQLQRLSVLLGGRHA